MSKSESAPIQITDCDEQIAKYRQEVIRILDMYGLDEIFTQISNEEITKEIKKLLPKNKVITTEECGKMIADVTGWDICHVIERKHVLKLYNIFLSWRDTINLCE
jgi:predicted transcriptional regulator